MRDSSLRFVYSHKLCFSEKQSSEEASIAILLHIIYEKACLAYINTYLNIEYILSLNLNLNLKEILQASLSPILINTYR
jgi:hypothetical protein